MDWIYIKIVTSTANTLLSLYCHLSRCQQLTSYYANAKFQTRCIISSSNAATCKAPPLTVVDPCCSRYVKNSYSYKSFGSDKLIQFSHLVCKKCIVECNSYELQVSLTWVCDEPTSVWACARSSVCHDLAATCYHTINVGCTVSHSSSCSRCEAVGVTCQWEWWCNSWHIYENTRSILPGFAACSLMPLPAWWLWTGENWYWIFLWCLQGECLILMLCLFNVHFWLDLCSISMCLQRVVRLTWVAILRLPLCG